MALKESGLDSVLIVGRLSARVPSAAPSVITTVSEGRVGPLEELRLAHACIHKERLTDVLVLRRGRLYLLLALWEALAGLVWGPRRRWILKLDWDGVAASRIEKVLWGPLLALCVAIFDKVVIETTCGLRRAAPMALRAPNFVVVPDGVASCFTPVKYESVPRAFRVLSVARLTRSKGIHELIEAFSLVSGEFPGWSLRIVGAAEDLDYLREVRELIVQFKLGGVVELIDGFVPDLRTEYLEASIYCHGSFRESFGISRIEAMSCALPVVTTDSGCAEDLKGWGAWVVPKGDVRAMASALRKLMASEELRRHTGNRSALLVPRWAHCARQLFD